MNTRDYIAKMKEKKEQFRISGKCNTDEFCRQLGIDVDELVHLFICIWELERYKSMRLRDQLFEKERELKRCEDMIDGITKGNGRLKQMVSVASGMPIAKKSKKNLADLAFHIRLGFSDEELQKYYNISRTTLWRWKKELEESQKLHEKRERKMEEQMKYEDWNWNID